MKKLFVKSIRKFFRISFFEKMLLMYVKGNEVQSYLTKFIPQYYTYKITTPIVAVNGDIAIN